MDIINDKESKELMAELSHYITPIDDEFKREAQNFANIEELLKKAKEKGIEFTSFQYMLIKRIHEIEG